MNKMIKDRPIKPEEVRARRIDFIPSIIFETINTMICEKFDGKSATLKQEDILNKVCNESSGLTRQEIFDKHYLDIEPFFIKNKVGKLNMINLDIMRIILQHLLLRYHE